MFYRHVVQITRFSSICLRPCHLNALLFSEFYRCQCRLQDAPVTFFTVHTRTELHKAYKGRRLYVHHETVCGMTPLWETFFIIDCSSHQGAHWNQNVGNIYVIKIIRFYPLPEGSSYPRNHYIGALRTAQWCTLLELCRRDLTHWTCAMGHFMTQLLGRWKWYQIFFEVWMERLTYLESGSDMIGPPVRWGPPKDI